MTSTPTDPEVARLAALPVSAVADVLDRLDRRSQAIAHDVRPLQGGPVSVTGRAFTIAASASDDLLENPYEHELAAVDATPAGAVVVLATGGLLDVAVWGELLTTRMLARGGVGVVTDGGIRDVAGIRGLGVPAFAAAITPRDSFGRALVTGWGEPVTCAGVPSPPATSCAATRTASSSSRGSSRPRRSPPPRRSSASSGSSPRALARGETAADLYDRYGVL